MTSIIKRKTIFGLVLLALINTGTVFGELLELKLHKTTYNLQSMGGLPISTTLADPIGSNGRGPSDDATPGQFLGFYSAGAVVAPSMDGALKLNQALSLTENIENLDLPRSEDGEFALINGASGGAIMSAQASIMFGGIISVPESIYENGEEVVVRNPDAYWSREPFKAKFTIVGINSPFTGIVQITTDIATDFETNDLVTMVGIRNGRYNGTYQIMTVSADKKIITYSLGMSDSEQFADHTLRSSASYNSSVTVVGLEFCQEQHSSDGYHYSPNAKAVFAIQAGPVTITWKESTSTTEQPDGTINLDWTKVANKDKYYKLYNKQYLVSSSAVKPPKRFYWNVLPAYTGPPLQLSDSVENIRIVYNANFPGKYFGTEYNNGVAGVEKNNTLWVQATGSHKSLKSINVEGRVFIELLGARRDGVPKHLGFEIVDVYQSSTPEDRVVYLGEKLLPYEDPNKDDSTISIRFEGSSESQHPKVLRNAFEGRISNYAIKETDHDERVVAFWNQLGAEDLSWPVAHVSYKFSWPEDLDGYSHYVRPKLNKNSSLATAIQLPMENAPILLYQDQDKSGNDRALITKEGFKFYSWMGGANPGSIPADLPVYSHRALVRYSSTQAGIKFERIFSWLDESITADYPMINTQPVRHLNLWPKITIKGNMDTQILLNTGDEYNSQKGKLRQQVFTGLGEQGGLDPLKNNENFTFPRGPESEQFVETFESSATSQSGDFATAIEGYFSPVESAEYQFSISYSGSSELKFSMGDSPLSGFNLIASTGSGVADENLSPYIYLEVDGFYYLQGLMRFQADNESFSVSFRKRGDDTFSALGTGNLMTGLRVEPLEQDMFVGDRVYFNASMSFVFGANAIKGTTVVAGELSGLITGTELSIDGLTGATFRTDLVNDFNDRALLDAPRYLTKTAYVGQRIQVPDGEYGSGEGDYWAGYIDERSGDLLPYHEGAYENPLDKGFALGNQGSIIPVNAAPNNRTITVNWFRKTTLDSDPKSGFDPIYWPSVIVRYTVEYPHGAREIVLASNDGSGPISSLEAKGTLYVQNNATKIGYNPNEEHALMVGGQAYALRDDLNIYHDPNRYNDTIGSKLLQGGDYSSAPFVLLEYIDSDGKISISTFKVLSEKPSEGMVFDYLSEAGSMMQAPMPLPLLPKPVNSSGTLLSGEIDKSEYDTPLSWPVLKDMSYFGVGAAYGSTTIAAADLPPKLPAVAVLNPHQHFTHYNKFTYEDRKLNTWVYRGRHAPLEAFTVGRYDSKTKSWVDPEPTEAVIGEEFIFRVHASRLEAELQMSASTEESIPSWLSADGISLVGSPGEFDGTAMNAGSIDVSSDPKLIILDKENDQFKAEQTVIIEGAGESGGILVSQIVSSFIDTDDNDRQKLRIKDSATSSVNNVTIYQVIPISLTVTESRENDSDTLRILVRVRHSTESTDDLFKDQGLMETGYVKGNKAIFPVGRPPYLSELPTGKNSFKMNYYYYYKEGFAFPGLSDDIVDGFNKNQVIPYLAKVGTTKVVDIDGSYGDPMEIVYRPVWPKTTSVLSRGDTLTLPKYGLPAMRGQSSAEVLYQQSIANASPASEDASTTEVTATQDILNEAWVTVRNPEGDVYGPASYTAVHIKINDPNGTDGQGYQAGTFVTSGIPVYALDSAVTSGSVFYFNEGSTKLTLNQNARVGATTVNGNLIGESIVHDQKGASGGLMVSRETFQRFTYVPPLVEIAQTNSANRNYSRGNGRNRISSIDVEALPVAIDVGQIISFNNGSSITVRSNSGRSYGTGYSIGATTIKGVITSTSQIAFRSGDSGTISGNPDPTYVSNAQGGWNAVNGTVLNFPGGAAFTLNQIPEAGDVSLSGTLTGTIVNGEVNYKNNVTLGVAAIPRGFSTGDAIFFTKAVFLLTVNAAAQDQTLTGTLTKGSIAQGEVGLNISDLIRTSESVKLIDPTREKTSNYTKVDGETFPPKSIPQSYYQGKIYFPTLDPHLSKRIFFDPNRGLNGALVLVGIYMDELVGEKYLQLNVLSESEYKDLLDLCTSADPANASWKLTVRNLKTELEYFTAVRDLNGNFIKSANGDRSYHKNVSEVAEIYSSNVPVDSYALAAVGPGAGYVSLIVGNGNEKVQPIGEPVTVHIIRVENTLHPGSLKVLQAENPLDERLTFQHSPDLAAKFDEYEYQWRKGYPVDGSHPPFDGELDELDGQWIVVSPDADGFGKNRFILGKKPGIDTLMDLYVTMRYRSNIDTHDQAWSDWTKPQLAEGWIKRVLAGINPFNQKVTDLFNNSANLDYSMLTQAGKRWEGDVALSLEAINDFGLIEIYETVLNKGKNLSINAGINHNGANNALLLAAGYLNDLYMMVGNDAFADAYNPTIGFSTSDAGEYGEMSTALFAFKGQLATLLDEELSLLRGRDDFMAPGVEANPVYNRLFWNYTRGIDSGEVIYSLNYNIKERDGGDLDGKIDAADATVMFPQGHGDAFGHYMTALKGYYKLLGDEDFTWVPQSESVLILGQEVAVDYMDERKFAAAAVAYGRAGSQIVDLTWRKDYIPGTGNGWAHLGAERENEKRYYRPITIENDEDGQPIERKNSVRSWGVDHWASRVGQGNYVNWLVGNAILPSVDDDPDHEGIQKVDRTTVLELYEIPALAIQVQTSLDNAAAGLNPLGLPENAVAFDINPTFMEVGSGIQDETHFDQIYKRAVASLDNAVSAFDASKNITSTIRAEQDTAADFAISVNSEELAYEHQLIEIYGTPYPEDIGPGNLYKQGYDGPDLLNHSYVDFPNLDRSTAYERQTAVRTKRIYIEKLFDVTASTTDLADGIIGNEIDKIVPFSPLGVLSVFDLMFINYNYKFNILQKAGAFDWKGAIQTETKGVHYVEYKMDDFGFFKKPMSYNGNRKSPGALQSGVHAILTANRDVENIIVKIRSQKRRFDLTVDLMRSVVKTKQLIETTQTTTDDANMDAADHLLAANTVEGIIDPIIEQVDRGLSIIQYSTPDDVIFGFSNGGNFLAPLKGILSMGPMIAITLAEIVKFGVRTAADAKENIAIHREIVNNRKINQAQDSIEIQSALIDLEDGLTEMRLTINEIDSAISNLDDAKRNYRATLASGDRLLKEREIFRKRSAALVQGYRTRDAAFRIFRNEKLERYKAMLDLASRYAFLAAKAFDYETGLLDTSKGKRFVSRIVASRALGVVEDGSPQFAGSNQGDPGLSSVLAEMSADFEVLRGRLGFNNPDYYGTTLSLRTENFRLLPNVAGDIEWKQILENGMMENLLVDSDAKQLCMQLDLGDGLPVPGIMLNFRTTIQDGYNLFGKKLAAGDHAFSPSMFATKLMGVGVALEGYEGIDYYDGDGNVMNPNPSINPNGLSATPYVYLIPVGLDSMRSPPLGDQSTIRTWNIEDATIPTPFNIGGSDFDSKKLFQTADSLTERMFNVRKHQAFRPVSDGSAFAEGPILPPSTIINNRLIGRSVWNSSWKLIIPGKALLYDSKEGLDKFKRTVTDIKIHFETYSYSGN